MTRVALLTGGATAERPVALAGAAQVLKALRQLGYQVTLVDTLTGAVPPEVEGELLQSEVGQEHPGPRQIAEWEAQDLGPALVQVPAVREADLVFVLLHGREGEGGQLQALLEMAWIPYVGSGPLASALAMDKVMAKRLLDCAGIPTPASVVWPGEPEEIISRLGLPLVVKPSKVGSTIGLTVIETLSQLIPAVELAQAYDDDVILEQYLPGAEYTVGILGDQALAVGEIKPKHGIFDYECKYTPGMCEEIFPADVDGVMADFMQELALQAHQVLGLRDFSRVDFKLDANGAPQCLELNTLPGLTQTSLLPQSAAAVGIDFETFCRTVCEFGLNRSPK